MGSSVGSGALGWMGRTELFHAFGDDVAAAYFDLNGNRRSNADAPDHLAADPGAVRQRSHFEGIVNDAVALADDHGMGGRIRKMQGQCAEIGYVLQQTARKWIGPGKSPEGWLVRRPRQMNGHGWDALLGFGIDEEECLRRPGLGKLIKCADCGRFGIGLCY